MDVRRDEQGGVTILRPAGKLLGGRQSESLSREINHAISGGSRSVLVDMAGVPWMNSSGLGTLLAGFMAIKAAGGTLKFMHTQPRVESVLLTTKLVTLLEVFTDEDQAIAGFEETMGQSPRS